MSVNKHAIMKTWVEQYLGEKMSFENINANPGAKSLVPDYGEFTIATDICGNMKKQYTFGFIAVELLDREDIETNNTDARQRVDDFNEWLVAQRVAGNFPNFGAKTSKYKIFPLQNTANMAQVFEDNGTAKYILMARIEYVESE